MRKKHVLMMTIAFKDKVSEAEALRLAKRSLTDMLLHDDESGEELAVVTRVHRPAT